MFSSQNTTNLKPENQKGFLIAAISIQKPFFMIEIMISKALYLKINSEIKDWHLFLSVI